MKTRTLKVALLQEADHGSRDANLDAIEAGLREAAAAGVQLVLLQELHNGPYFCQHESVDEFDRAESIPGPSTERLGALAAELKLVVVASLFERRAAGLYHNTAVVFDRSAAIAGKADCGAVQVRPPSLVVRAKPPSPINQPPTGAWSASRRTGRAFTPNSRAGRNSIPAANAALPP
jgi:hypothetical protein